MNSNGQLRVLQVGKFYPPHLGGMETHVQTLAAELRKSLHVKVLVANDTWRQTESTIDGVEVTRVGTVVNLAGAPICPQMAPLIRESDADVVHLHLPNPTAVLAYLMSGRRGPVVVTWHSDVVRQKRLARLFDPLQRLILDRSSAVITTSANYVASSPTLTNYLDRCYVIPLGVSVKRYKSCDSAQVNALRAQYGPRIALSVGRLVYYKGIEYLVEAMASVRGRLLVLGDGPLRAELESKVRRLGLEDRVVLLGAVPDLVPFYHACDVFVLPSIARSEAFGMVQVEAMACGKPVVNTQLPSGVPFVSVDGMTGLTVPPANPEALADAINCLLDDSARCAAYGHAAMCRVREEFTVEKMVSRTIALYSAITSANGNGKLPAPTKATPEAEVSATAV
ncbi:MAG: glycosyltransferase [Candidatus Binataceae bacterium]